MTFVREHTSLCKKYTKATLIEGASSDSRVSLFSLWNTTLTLSTKFFLANNWDLESTGSVWTYTTATAARHLSTRLWLMFPVSGVHNCHKYQPETHKSCWLSKFIVLALDCFPRCVGSLLILKNIHGQQCNVTYRKPGQDLPGSNPVVSHFFTLIILYREAQNYSSCFLFSKTNGVWKPLQVILH